MNRRQRDKRHDVYAKRLYALKLIDRRIYGLMLVGWATYDPGMHEVTDYTRSYRYRFHRERLKGKSLCSP